MCSFQEFILFKITSNLRIFETVGYSKQVASGNGQDAAERSLAGRGSRHGHARTTRRRVICPLGQPSLKPQSTVERTARAFFGGFHRFFFRLRRRPIVCPPYAPTYLPTYLEGARPPHQANSVTSSPLIVPDVPTNPQWSQPFFIGESLTNK